MRKNRKGERGEGRKKESKKGERERLWGRSERGNSQEKKKEDKRKIKEREKFVSGKTWFQAERTAHFIANFRSIVEFLGGFRCFCTFPRHIRTTFLWKVFRKNIHNLPKSRPQSIAFVVAEVSCDEALNPILELACIS